MTNAFEYLVWVDVETTGLKTTDRLLEIAAIVTSMDARFTEWGEPFQRVIALGDIKVQDVDPFVLEMHAKNGLWEAAKNSRLTRDAALRELYKWFAKLTEQDELNGGTFYWAGRSLHFDLRWVTESGLDGVQNFSHRRYDLTSIKAFLSVAGIEVAVPEENHRALDDVRGDIVVARQTVARVEALR